VSYIVIDTTQVSTDTIAYVVTDSASLTSTSTRTVIVEPDSAESPTGVIIQPANAPPIVPPAAASTTSTSSAQ
jgi:hypothetical protein